MRKFYQSLKELSYKKQAAVAAVLMTAPALAHASAFYQPFCSALNFFSGKSPLVAFVVMAGGFGILVTLLMGEDRGILMTVVKWVAGGAGLIGITSLVSMVFGSGSLSMCGI